ncbi:uncharacterized protein LOC120076712 [Benincasa hispida]|uniref:uncharacterized protein LOC120076712 n=1 Tax=Benincasa hispida TaxID=102211 RepID=UPI0018FFB7DF|nr:uncharacterized protein LOC120076712 [Benincasa hispida]
MAAASSRTNICCLLVVAMMAVTLCSKGQAALISLNLSLDLCQRADFPALCRSVVKGIHDPSVAIESTIKQLMFQTKQAMNVARRRKSSAMDVCIEVYDDAYSNLETCLSSLQSHDKGTLNINLSAALTDYVTCDDAVAEIGLISPVTRTNDLMRRMASNCLYLSSLIHLR